MQLYYVEIPLGNFGDDLNLWLWDELLPGWRGWDPDRVLVGVGTLLGPAFLRREEGGRRRYLVAGTGVSYGVGALPDVSDRSRWDVRSVRGPRSARALGLPEELAVIDPAAMLPSLPGFRGAPSGSRPIFVPHVSTVTRHDWAGACAEVGIDFVSPQGEAKAVIARIAGAPLVLAESMHAAIVADAFRVPWIPVAIGHEFFPNKWFDWAESLDLELGAIEPLFPVETAVFASLRRAAAFARRRGRDAPEPRVGDERKEPPGSGRLARLRLSVERRQVVPALRRTLRKRPMLSQTAKLERQLGRYRSVLDGIRADYGGAGGI